MMRQTVDRPTTMNEYVTCSVFWLGYLLVSVYVIYLGFGSLPHDLAAAPNRGGGFFRLVATAALHENDRAIQ